MKIGIDCRLWNESGVGRYTRNLVKHLQNLDKDNNYVLFCLSKDFNQVQFSILNSQFSIVPADIRWHTVEEQVRFPGILNKENLDLVHFPYFSVPIMYNGKFVITIHDLILHHFQSGKASTHSHFLYGAKLKAYKFILQRAAKKAEKIITVSKSTKNDIMKTLNIDSRKIEVAYEGIDNELKVKSSKSKVRKNEELEIGNYFLYVGNAYPHKNLDRLIEAFRKVHLEHNDLKLVLVGKEDYFYKKLKEQISKIKIEDSVIFTDYITDEELGNLYRKAKATVCPSILEGFGLSGLEAMANRCLVLASDIAVYKELYGDVPSYFDPYDVNKIAIAMDSCLNDSNHSNKINLGIKQTEKFSWEKMAKQTLAVYNSISA